MLHVRHNTAHCVLAAYFYQPLAPHVWPAGDGGVIKTVVAEGTGWQNPKDADEVVVTYVARVRPPTQQTAPGGAAPERKSAAELGAPVAAESAPGGVTFDIGAAPCSGLAAALRSMKPKERATVLLKPECELLTHASARHMTRCVALRPKKNAVLSHLCSSD